MPDSPPPVDQPIGPPLPVHSVRRTGSHVYAEVHVPADHPAHAVLTAHAADHLTVTALTGAPGSLDHSPVAACPAPEHCATHGTGWSR